jgi:hypothetical protein
VEGEFSEVRLQDRVYLRSISPIGSRERRIVAVRHLGVALHVVVPDKDAAGCMAEMGAHFGPIT